MLPIYRSFFSSSSVLGKVWSSKCKSVEVSWEGDSREAQEKCEEILRAIEIHDKTEITFFL